MNWIERIARLEGWIIALCSLIVAAAFSMVVFVRYVLGGDLFAYEEIVLPVAFVLYFIGAARASHDDMHIKADLVVEGLKNPRARKAYQIFIFCVEGLIAGIFAYLGLKMFIAEFAKYPSMARTSVYSIPLAAPRFFIFVGFSLMALHSFAHAYRHYLIFRSGQVAQLKSERGSS
ncbi:TRAP transporter small permease [Aquamicrobium defluvii]|uniref:TRAP transporter small permease protein n=1 Tax=Aquamicrobium defluvii TaxID=69279 RepID=A0A4R6YFB1_9HYPH|nr:TRAP transporter small permease subunit [Aquamicrobium defluvii]TDR34829.1 TRAP-type C4-dicarboxylate transport system permease small subunit [Aquamicrobium defluvii]